MARQAVGDVMGRERLTPEEDHALRRLHWFEALGCELSSAMRTLKDGFRQRDRRREIRDPFHVFDRNGAATPQVKADAAASEPPGYWVQANQPRSGQPKPKR